MKRLSALAFVCALLLAACGGSHSTTTTTSIAPVPVGLAHACPPGNSFAGCAQQTVKQPPPSATPKLAPIGGAEFPDVSDWQGPITPNGRDAGVNWGAVAAWQRAHGWPVGGGFKLGEYTFDPDAGTNSAAISRLGGFKFGYWFVRNIGCAKEAGLIHQAAIWWHLSVVALDVEVPEAAGYTTCLIPALRPFIAHVIVYTGPGTWPGGKTYGVPLWDAAYNFSGPQFGGLWTTHAVAWQFTDGTFAARTDVPGIGFDDVNVDMGLGALARGKPAPPSKDPYAILDRTKRHFRIRAYSPTFGAPSVVVASEYNTVRTGYARGCRKPLRRRVCETSDYHLRLLRGRLITVGQREHPPYRIKGQGARQTILAKAEKRW